jgi:thioredoxin
MPEAELIRCSHCGAQNRVPREKTDRGLVAICGRCKASLRASGQAADHHPMAVSDATFAEQVEKSPLPVLVDMWAEWCGPCRYLSPVVDELAAEMAGRMRFAKLNVDENPAISNRFKIRSIPALVIFKDGHEVDRLIGLQPKAEIARRLQRWL